MSAPSPVAHGWAVVSPRPAAFSNPSCGRKANHDNAGLLAFVAHAVLRAVSPFVATSIPVVAQALSLPRRDSSRRPGAPWSLRGFALSLTFQAQLLALAQPRHARFGAANASERPWAYAKINGAATVRERSVLLKSPVLPPASGPPKGIKTGGFSTERPWRTAKPRSSRL